MSGTLYEKIQQILNRIRKFESPDLTPYVHCSKLNSLLFVLKEAGQILEKAPNDGVKVTMKQINALTSIHSIIEQFDELFRSCKSETCVQFLLSMPVTGVKYEVTAL